MNSIFNDPILIVVVNADLRVAYDQLLSKNGYKVTCTGTGQGALDLVDREAFSLVLLDEVLPDIPGLEVLKKIKSDSVHENLFVVLISSLATSSAKQNEGFETGADGYIVTPLKNREFLARIEDFIRHKRTLDKLMASELRFKRLAGSNIEGKLVVDAEEKLLNKDFLDLKKEVLRTEKHFRLLIEQAPDGVVLIGSDGNFKYLSPSALRLFGHTQGTRVLTNPSELTHPDDLPMVLSVLTELITNPEYLPTIEYRLLHADGSWRWIESTFTNLLAEPAVEAIVINFRDISARKAAEQALEYSEKWYRSLIENSSDAIVVIDPQGTLLYETPASKVMSGRRVDERIGKNVFENIHPGDIPALKQLLDEALQQPEEVQHITVRYQHQDGSWLWLECALSNLLNDPAVKGIVVNVHDITRQTAAREAMRLSEAKYQGLFEANKDGISIFILDKEEKPGNFIEVNTAAASMIGYTKKEMLNLSVLDLEVGADESQLKARGNEIREKGFVNVETKLRHKNGTELTVDLQVLPVLYNNSIALMSIVKDITERKLAEVALLESERLLRESQSIAKLGSFVWDFSTDIWESSEILNQIFGIDEKYIRTFDSWVNIVHPEWREMMADYVVNEVLGKHQEFNKEYLIVRPDNGQECWVHGLAKLEVFNNNLPAKLIGTISDITKRKKAEETLARSEQKYRLMADNVSDVIWSMDNDFKFTFISPSIMQLRGLSQEEAMNEPFESSMTPESLQIVQNAVKKSIEEEKLGIHQKQAVIEIQQYHKNGMLIWVELAVQAMLDSDGKKIGLIGISRDITKRKTAEAALVASEQKYRKLHESMMDGYVFVDMQGFIRDYNESYRLMLGYNTNELLQLTFRDITPGQWHKFEASVVSEQVLPRGFSDIYHKEYRKKDGTVFPVEVHAFLIKSDAGENEGIWAIVRDITKRKMAEEALQLSEQRFKKVFNEAPMGIALIESLTGIIKEVNPMFAKISGRSIDEMKHIDWMSITHPDDVQKNLDYTASMNAGKITGFTMEKRYLHKDGSPVWINMTAAQLNVEDNAHPNHLCMIENITDRKVAEIALQESEEKYRDMVALLPDAVFIHADGKILFANPATLKMVEAESFEQLAEKNVSEFIHPEFMEHRKQSLANILLSKDKAIFREEKFLKMNKDVIDVEVFEIPVTFMGKLAIQSIAKDITQRKKAEYEIKLKDELLHLTGKMAKVGGWEFDPVSLQGIWSDQTAMIHDMDTGMLGNAELGFRFYSDESGSKIRQAVQAVIEKRIPYDLELELTSAKGIHKWVRTIGVPVEKDGKIIKVRGTIQDITDRKTSELVIENERRRLRTLIETIPDLIWLKDPEGTYTLCNPVFEQYLGATETEIIGKTDFDFESKDVAAANQLRDKNVIASKSSLVYQEWVINKADSEQRLLEITKTPMYEAGFKLIGILGVARDITAIYKSQESLREREEIYSTIVNQANDSVVLIDPGTGGFAEYNKAAYTSLGYTFDEFAKLTLFDIEAKMKGDSQIENLKGLKKDLASVYETSHRTKDGRFRDVRVSTMLINIRGKDYMSSIWSDITERKGVQEELHKMNAELELRVKQRTLEIENANKELDSFSYSVSHDLRAPLRGIDGWSLALLQDYNHALDEQGRVYLTRVRGEAQRMGNLIDDLLKLSRLNRSGMTKENIDISAIAQTIADRLLESHTGRHCKVIVQPGLFAFGDPNMLEIALTNLLDNAFKFTGKIDHAKIEFGLMPVDGVPTYYVRDNGAGFDMEFAKKLFGAFQRMHKQSDFPGSGIGLATVKRIISRHGGHIWAHSEPGKGATFYFTILQAT